MTSERMTETPVRNAALRWHCIMRYYVIVVLPSFLLVRCALIGTRVHSHLN